MPSLHRVVNHFKYWRSNWTVVASSFILALSGVLVAGTIARAGENALAYYGDLQGYNNGCQNNCGSYPQPTQPVNQPCQQQCDDGYGGGYGGGDQGYPDYPSGDQNGPGPDNGYPGGGDQPQPSPQPSESPAPSESPVPQAPVNSINNSGNSTATANVVVNTAGVKSAPAPAPSSGAIMLPETGPVNGIMNLVGIGGLVAAGSAYALSRRELLRTVFRK